MAVAAAALVVAIAGTAVAGVATVSVLNKKEKKQVRKIARQVANQRIAQRAADLRVRSAGSADTAKAADTAKVADTATVAGNVSNQFWGVVNLDGTLSRATPGIVGSTRENSGQYLVTVDRAVANCFYVATLGGNTADEGFRGDISVNPVSGNPNIIYVLTSSQEGVAADRPFTLLIRC